MSATLPKNLDFTTNCSENRDSGDKHQEPTKPFSTSSNGPQDSDRTATINSAQKTRNCSEKLESSSKKSARDRIPTESLLSSSCEAKQQPDKSVSAHEKESKMSNKSKKDSTDGSKGDTIAEIEKDSLDPSIPESGKKLYKKLKREQMSETINQQTDSQAQDGTQGRTPLNFPIDEGSQPKTPAEGRGTHTPMFRDLLTSQDNKPAPSGSSSPLGIPSTIHSLRSKSSSPTAKPQSGGLPTVQHLPIIQRLPALPGSSNVTPSLSTRPALSSAKGASSKPSNQSSQTPLAGSKATGKTSPTVEPTVPSRIFQQPVLPMNARLPLPGSKILETSGMEPNPSSLKDSKPKEEPPQLAVRSGSGSDFMLGHNAFVSTGTGNKSLLHSSPNPTLISESHSSTPSFLPALGSVIRPTNPSKSSASMAPLPGSAVLQPSSVPSPVIDIPTFDSNQSTDTNSVHISFEGRDFSEFPKRILDVPKISSLNGSRNNLSTLPLQFGEVLTELLKLELSSNAFKELPYTILELPVLKYLDVSKNRISTLPSGISYMTNLTHLNVSLNKFKIFPTHLCALNSLEHLYMEDNKIKSIPSQIKSLNRLKELRLNRNELESIPSELCSLSRLNVLTLGSNSIPIVPSDAMLLSSLTELDLSDNSFAGPFPGNLCFSTGLVHLNLDKNEISSVDSNISQLVNLKTLNLNSNKLHALPSEFGLVSNLQSLSMMNNPLTGIPDKYREAPERMNEYLHDLKSNAIWKRSKLVFLGEECVGKTSLRLHLHNNFATLKEPQKKKRNTSTITSTIAGSSFNPVSSSPGGDPIATDGIDIDDWEPIGTNTDGGAPTLFSTWDFAGQQIYHPTHQFFLTKRSFYLIIFNIMEEKMSRLEYWLKTIKSRVAGYCPVVIVGTHRDDKRCDKKYIEAVFAGMRKKYDTRFPFIRGYHAVSSKTGKGMGHLVKTLVDLARASSWFKSTPREYIKLEKSIIQIRTNTNTMSLNEFHGVAENAGIQKATILECLEFMHDVGILIYFNDRKSELADLVILDPLWIVNLLSSVISLKHSYVNDGLMMASALPQIWKDYPPSEYNWLLKLLEKFEITFRIPANTVDSASKQLSSKSSWLAVLDQNADSQQLSSPGNQTKPSDSAHRRRMPSMDFSAGLEDIIVVPSLLPQVPDNNRLFELWRNPTHFVSNSSSGRRYIFQFLPLGFFSRLIVRTLHVGSLIPQYLWRDGMIIDTEYERAILINNDLDYNLDIVVKTKKPGSTNTASNEPQQSLPSKQPPLGGSFTLLRQLVDNIETLLVSWFKLKPIVQVPCHLCLNDLEFTQHDTKFDANIDLYYFPIEECMLAVRENQKAIHCKSNRNRVSFMQMQSISNLSGVDNIFSELPEANSSQRRRDAPGGSLRGSIIGVVQGEKAYKDLFGIFGLSSNNNNNSIISSSNLPAPHSTGGQSTPRNSANPQPTHPTPTNTSNPQDPCNSPPFSTATSSSPSSFGNQNLVHTILDSVQGPHICVLSELCPDIAFSDVQDLTINYNDLELINKVGEGSYAILWKGQFKGDTVAVKVLKQQESQMDLLSESFRELQHETFVMKNLKNPFLVELRNICTSPLAMVMDFFALGSLDRYLHKASNQKVRFSWKYRIKLASNIAKGMAYLHSEDLIHRDLRSPNILLVSLDDKAEVVAKVADFGLAVICARDMRGGDFNECWTAPEILMANPYNAKVDQYSFGIVLWELLQNGFPFFEYSELYAGKPRLDFFQAIIDGLRPTFPSGCPDDYQNLVNACWAADPIDRPSFSRISEMLDELAPIAAQWDSGLLQSSLVLPGEELSLPTLTRKKSKAVGLQSQSKLKLIVQ